MLALLYACSIDDRTLVARSSTTTAGAGSQESEDGAGGGAGEMAAGAAAGMSDAEAGQAATPTTGGEPGTGPTQPTVDGCADLDENAVPDCDETLVDNSTFDADAAHWVADLNANQAWAPDDAGQRSGSGSLGVVNSNVAELPNLSLGGSRQCVRLASGGWYRFLAHLYIAPDQGSTGSGGIAVQFFRSDDCTGTRMENFGGTSPLVHDTGEWRAAELEAEAPANAQSMSVQMVAIKPFDEPSLTVLFDDVLVRAKE